MKKLYALFILLLGMGAAQAQCITPAWGYMTPVTVTNPNPTTLTDFQVLLTLNTAAMVSAGKLQADGDDLRFTDGTCCNQLCYAIESGMNTATTRIWVKIPSLAASGTADIKMFYANPTATAGENANCTWDMWEPFDSPVNHFTASCGSGTYNVTGGAATISWGSNYVVVSDLTFPVGTVYTAESDITAASGNWPGVNWSRAALGNHFGYSILLGSGVRIGKSGASASDYCRGENWASSVFTTPGSVVGLWSITWIATGSSVAEFPGLGIINSTDTEHARSSDLKVCLGGISGGTGSMTMNWVRVRKYAASSPTFMLGTEAVPSYAATSLGPDIDACDGSTVILAPGTFSTYSWSDGSMDSTLTVTSSGTYWVAVTAGAGSCPGSDTININYLAPIVLSLADTLTFCEGDTLMLDAGAGYASYDWSTGDLTQVASITAGGVVDVIVTDSAGCMGYDTVMANMLASPVITAADTAWACPGDSFLLDAGAGFSSYLWSTGATTQTIVVGAGDYDVTVTNAAGCDASATLVAAVSALPTVSFTTAPGSSASEIEFTSTGSSGVSYVWDFGDGGTSTSANPVHTYTSDSTYNVCLTVTDLVTGCSNTHCEDVVITALAAPQMPGSFSVFPNPAQDLVHVQFSLDRSQTVKVEILDLRGVTLLTRSVTAAEGDMALPLDKLAPALYLVRITTEQGSQLVRLAVQ